MSSSSPIHHGQCNTATRQSRLWESRWGLSRGKSGKSRRPLAALNGGDKDSWSAFTMFFFGGDWVIERLYFDVFVLFFELLWRFAKTHNWSAKASWKLACQDLHMSIFLKLPNANLLFLLSDHVGTRTWTVSWCCHRLHTILRLKSNPSQWTKELSVRGSCFKHTAFTELRMNQLVQDVLQQQGLDCANRTPGNNKKPWVWEWWDICTETLWMFGSEKAGH